MYWLPARASAHRLDRRPECALLTSNSVAIRDMRDCGGGQGFSQYSSVPGIALGCVDGTTVPEGLPLSRADLAIPPEACRARGSNSSER